MDEWNGKVFERVWHWDFPRAVRGASGMWKLSCAGVRGCLKTGSRG